RAARSAAEGPDHRHGGRGRHERDPEHRGGQGEVADGGPGRLPEAGAPDLRAGPGGTGREHGESHGRSPDRPRAVQAHGLSEDTVMSRGQSRGTMSRAQRRGTPVALAAAIASLLYPALA